MPLAVDTYGLGPLQTNCYVVRAERGAPEAVVVDPGGDAAQLRLERDEDDATLAVLGMEDDGRSRTVGCLDLIELPVLHARSVTAARKSYTSASLDSPT